MDFFFSFRVWLMGGVFSHPVRAFNPVYWRKAGSIALPLRRSPVLSPSFSSEKKCSPFFDLPFQHHVTETVRLRSLLFLRLSE